MKNNFEILKTRIFQKDEINRLLSFWRFKNKRIVFTNGCFDLLHRGHIEYLAKASNLGDVLIIGLNTDASVKRLKGDSRPLQDEYTRALVLSSLRFVDAVVYFDEDTPYEIIKYILPDVLVKGSDYKPENIVGMDIVVAKGGKVETIDFVEGFSTTGIIGKINS